MDVQEFTVAKEVSTNTDGATNLMGCGALHVMWDDIAEVRTLAVRRDRLHHGIGAALLGDFGAVEEDLVAWGDVDVLQARISIISSSPTTVACIS